MFDFVFGDQKFPSNTSSRESMAVVSRLPRKEVCGGERGGVVGKPGVGLDVSGAESMAVVDRVPRKEVCGVEIGDVVGKPKSQNGISIFATPLPEFVVEQRQRKLSRESGGSTGSVGSRLTEPQPPTCTIIEEGREWYGYRDEGVRRAAEMFGVTGPWIRPSCGTEDVDGIDGTKERVKKNKPFWHGNGRKVGVNGSFKERWMCVGDDEFGISDDLVVGEGAGEGSEGSEGSVGSEDSNDSTEGRGEYGGERKWWRVRWKHVSVGLGCGVLA